MYTIIFAIAAVLCLAACVIIAKKEPRNILMGFAAILALILGFFSVIIMTPSTGTLSTFMRVLLYLAVILLFLTGVFLIVDFVMVFRREGLSVPNLLPLAFGMITVVSSIAYYIDLSSGISGSKLYVEIMSVLFNIALYAPFAIGAFLLYSIIYLCLPKSKNPSYIIVLGCGLRKDGEVTPLLRGRVDRAVKCWKKSGEKAKFVVSGGQGSDEVISEAQAMKNYLLTQNVPEGSIILESKSVNTNENLKFSKELIEKDGGSGDILICTSNYHVPRAVILAKKLGIKAEGIGGHTALYYLPVAFFREYIAMIFKYKAIMLAYIVAAVVTGIII